MCSARAHNDFIAGQIASIDDLGDAKNQACFSRPSIMASRQGKLIAQLCGKLRLLPRVAATALLSLYTRPLGMAQVMGEGHAQGGRRR